MRKERNLIGITRPTDRVTAAIEHPTLTSIRIKDHETKHAPLTARQSACRVFGLKTLKVCPAHAQTNLAQVIEPSTNGTRATYEPTPESANSVGLLLAHAKNKQNRNRSFRFYETGTTNNAMTSKDQHTTLVNSAILTRKALKSKTNTVTK